MTVLLWMWSGIHGWFLKRGQEYYCAHRKEVVKLACVAICLRLPGNEKLFGGGDALKVDLITTAVGHGRKAANSIDAFIKGEPHSEQGYREVTKVQKQDVLYFTHSEQAKRETIELENVVGNHDELLVALTANEVKAEAEWCMSCGLCFDCKKCLSFCPQEAVARLRDNPSGEVGYTKELLIIKYNIIS